MVQYHNYDDDYMEGSLLDNFEKYVPVDQVGEVYNFVIRSFDPFFVDLLGAPETLKEGIALLHFPPLCVMAPTHENDMVCAPVRASPVPQRTVTMWRRIEHDIPSDEMGFYIVQQQDELRDYWLVEVGKEIDRARSN